VIKKVKYPVIFYVGVLIILFFCFIIGLITSFIFYSILYASILIAVNFLLFIILYHNSYKKSNKTFLIYNLGGIGFRLALMLIGVFVVIKFLKIDEYGFIFALFIWYILFLGFEINILRKSEKL
jgi:hypothetical protein